MARELLESTTTATQVSETSLENTHFRTYRSLVVISLCSRQHSAAIDLIEKSLKQIKRMKDL